MKMLKDARMVLLIVLTLSSVVILAYPYVTGKSGVTVTSISPSARCTGVSAGSVITQASGGDIRNTNDFQRIMASVKAGDYVTLVVDGGPGGCAAPSDGNVGLAVDNMRSSSIKFSPDIQGSTKTTYAPTDNLTATDTTTARNIIQQRVRALNLQYTAVDSQDSSIAITAPTSVNPDGLLAPCNLVGRITTAISLENGTGRVKVGNDTYGIGFYGTNVNVSGSVYSASDTITIGGVQVRFSNITNSSAAETVQFLRNGDVISASGYGGTSRDQTSGEYYFNIPIVASESSTDTLKTMAKSLGTTFAGGQLALNGNIEYYLDGVLLSRLPMPYTLATQPIQSLSVIGVGAGAKAVDSLRTKAQMCLSSQPLGIAFGKTGTVTVDPTNRNAFYYTLAATLALPILFFLVMYVRTKSVKESAALISLAQMPITLGAAAFTQMAFPVSWVVDLPTAMGIFVSLFAVLSTSRFSGALLKNGVSRHADIIVFLVGFVVLFTPLKGLGLSLLVGWFLKVTAFGSMIK